MRLRARAAIFPLLAVAALTAGCSTRTIKPRDAIPVPAGLSAAEVGESIEGAATHCNLFNFRMLCWKVLRREPGHLRLEGTVVNRALQLAVDYDAQRVVTRIVSSRNFQQDGDEIHRNAIRVQGWLEARIAMYLQQAAGPKDIVPGDALEPEPEPEPESGPEPG